jgi:hypothetical protein
VSWSAKATALQRAWHEVFRAGIYRWTNRAGKVRQVKMRESYPAGSTNVGVYVLGGPEHGSCCGHYGTRGRYVPITELEPKP